MLKLCQKNCLDDIQAKFEYRSCPVKNQVTQSKENLFLHSVSHIFGMIMLKLYQNVCLSDIQTKFEYGPCPVKNQVTRPNLRKILLTLWKPHFLLEHGKTLSESLSERYLGQVRIQVMSGQKLGHQAKLWKILLTLQTAY